jgi:hypothetical protein
MAAKAGTLLKLTTQNSSSPGYLTFATLTTASTTGVYFDLTGYKGDKVIFVADVTATNVASASAQNRVRINKGSTITKYSGYTRGALNVQFTSNRKATARFGYFGPYELSRFKDSNERITISCSGGGCNIKAIAAIIIE